MTTSSTQTARGERKLTARAVRQRQARERARVAAAAAERAAKELAPRANGLAVTARDGTVLRGPRVAIERGMPVHANPVAGLIGQGGEPPPSASRFVDNIGELANESATVTAEHLRAARRLQADWREVGEGVGVSGVNYATLAIGRTSGTSVAVGEARHGAILRQMRTRERPDSALLRLGPLCDIVAPIVLDGVPIAAWSCDVDMNPRAAVG